MTDDSDLDLSKAPLLSHLLELRRRLLFCLVFFVVAFGTSYQFAEQIYAFLLQPLTNAFSDATDRRMIYTGLHEAFFTYLKLSFFAAVFFSLPLILLQFWRFIAPGLYRFERTAFLPLVFATPLLFLCGAALAYYGVMPLAWKFFLSFESLGAETGLAVQLEARVSEYLGLVIKLIIAFALSFELPVVLVLLAKVGMVTADSLVEYRKHAAVLAFVVAALLTPPDLISQITLGLPIIVLYELSILFIRRSNADRVGRERLQTAHHGK
ncbi:twin-arginine translocase subunit TatC [Exilibacterium tricleocarpae]|uniref:Sec-independent protein translocase protein TatC n=1 Tax=Exilibacterium tricleocarpae TaxID=2591008 RepID=A0A545ST50_9GAMM|nr:twin-arginine translocase subunit TatC [Exilibacterium tricleocarpae]TQV68144.1 twin-arginine translocase subunit TatC [Exilibacterium tricleocarpae]